MKLKNVFTLFLTFTILNSYALAGQLQTPSRIVNTDSLKVPFYFAIPKGVTYKQ